jgi:hypothetical protein
VEWYGIANYLPTMTDADFTALKNLHRQYRPAATAVVTDVCAPFHRLTFVYVGSTDDDCCYYMVIVVIRR